MSTGGNTGGVFGYLSCAEIIKINLKELNYETLSIQLLEKRSHHAVVELDGKNNNDESGDNDQDFDNVIHYIPFGHNDHPFI